MPIHYTVKDIKRALPDSYFSRGNAYFKQGRVKQVVFSEDKRLLTGIVKGNASRPYEVKISFINQISRGFLLNGQCSCPMVRNCKHVAAVLLAGLEKMNGKEVVDEAALDLEFEKFNGKGAAKEAALELEEDKITDYRTAEWMRKIEQVLTPSHVYPPTVKKRLLFLLDIKENHNGKKLIVQPASGNIRKDGTFGRWSGYDADNACKPNPAKFLRSDDLSVLRRLAVLNGHRHTHAYGWYPLDGREGLDLLKDMLTAGRCYWREPKKKALSWGEERLAKIDWNMAADGSQHVVCELENKADHVLPLSPPCYLDLTEHRCGELNTGLSDDIAGALMQAPPLKPAEIKAVRKKLSTFIKDEQAILPRTFERTEQKKIDPAPHLYLSSTALRQINHSYYWNRADEKQVQVPIARLGFLYDSVKVDRCAKENRITTVDGNKLVYIERNIIYEAKMVNYLAQYGFLPLHQVNFGYRIPEENRNDFVMADRYGDLDDTKEIVNQWLGFNLNIVPMLRNEGWIVEIAPDFPHNVVEPDDEWYADIDESSGIDWFDVELGVMVAGERVNLLPVLLSGIRQNPNMFADLEKMPKDSKIFCHLPDNRKLALPSDRLRLILSFLKDLYSFDSLGEDGKLKLSRLDAADLPEFEAAMEAVNMRWFGGERVKRLGQKLKSFTGVSTIDVPRDFQGSLRHYQREGLDWLQFLREYDLAGILADDMGLGKTVQTLADIAHEKENNRLDKPVLVVAPTSLMFNWRMEAERFTPNLKVLTLHGADRKAHFDKIKEHDVVLTTYALLPRDKDELLKEEYHSVVLDEAQYIKNPKAKVTQVAAQLKTGHRLCLTGTPLENHLGELWSLFNFLLPGLLGDEKQFRQFYRKPIEKEQNSDRLKALVRRLKPFMLRRTKEKVLSELPPKTEMLRTCDLKKSQRDLYETIRISMHEKVRKAIADKGVARSHIVVLTALLKLRQVCCDPRLLKMEADRKVKHSAKLEQLMEMVPEMIEEGRRILLFSQFVSMLKLIEEAFSKEKIAYVKLTGQTKDRQTPIQSFQSGNIPVFLISLKAGGTGLNLTAADTVIHYDPWWNPAVENQATDRAHRIGQDKPVFVYKLITAGTVEEKILQMQEKKRELAQGIFDPGGKTKTGGKLTGKDINALFEPIG